MTTREGAVNWYLAALKNYGVFSGRARRKEYCYFMLFANLILGALMIIDGVAATFDAEAGIGLFSGLYALAVMVPALAVSVRRLHDTNRSGSWEFLVFVPLIGAIVLLVFYALDSKPGENQYGPNPKQA